MLNLSSNLLARQNWFSLKQSFPNGTNVWGGALLERVLVLMKAGRVPQNELEVILNIGSYNSTVPGVLPQLQVIYSILQ